jgi:pyridoxal phosphate enzyme (YggS family)
MDIQNNLATVKRQIQQLCQRYNRKPESIRLLAVSKTFPGDKIREAHACGQHAFGENYVDEALIKIHSLSDLKIEWHYIGPIQSNKTRKLAENFQWIHSLASLKHARRLSNQRPAGMPPINICLQVNISAEESKSGLELDSVTDLADELQNLPGLQLRGIMGIPAKSTELAQQRQAFSSLASIYRQLQEKHENIDTLSMGMSGDMEAAIAEGSTLLRIGTAIFGARKPAR